MCRDPSASSASVGSTNVSRANGSVLLSGGVGLRDGALVVEHHVVRQDVQGFLELRSGIVGGILAREIRVLVLILILVLVLQDVREVDRTLVLLGLGELLLDLDKLFGRCHSCV